MPGSKQKRKGDGWMLSVEIGADYRGKRRRFNKMFHGTEKAAEKALAAFYTDCMRGDTDVSGSGAIRQMVESYINDRPTGSIKANTIKGYTSTAEHWIYPYIGDLKISKATPRKLQGWIDDLSDKYAPKTVKNAVSLLRSSFQRMVKFGELSSNPCSLLTLPKPEHKEAEYYDQQEVTTFIQALSTMEGDQLPNKVAFELALFCGLRKGEILGLDWNDIDLTEHTLTVRQTRYEQKGAQMQVDTPKTAKSRRTVTWPPEIRPDLVSLKRLYSEKKLLLGSEWNESPALIRGLFGKPVYGSELLKALHRLQHENNLKQITLHQLRHTNVSIMISLGLDIKTIQARGGYSTASTPLEIYGHLFEKHDKEIAKDIYKSATKTKPQPIANLRH